MAYTRSPPSPPTTITPFKSSRVGGRQWPFLSDPGRTVQQDLDIAEYTDPGHNPMIRTRWCSSPAWSFTLSITATGSGAARRSTTCGMTCVPPRAEIRPDWDLSTPGLREAGDAGDYSKFHGWDRRTAESMPTSYD